MSDDLLVAQNLEVAFGRGAGAVKVLLCGVSLRINRGETIGIVGESGSGKTTLGRALLRLVDVTAGRIVFDGREITRLAEAEMRPLRRRMQLIFQDPMASLNPRHTIRRIVSEPMLYHGVATDEADAERRARAIFDRFSLPWPAWPATPTNSRAASASESASPAPRCSRPSSCSRTRSYRDSTSRPRRRRSICSKACRATSVWRWPSSATISRSFAPCATASTCCARDLSMEEGECEAVFSAPRHAYTRALLDAIPPPRIDPGWLQRDSSSSG